mgnify:FL=1|tara:strand:- start:1057 stop:1425 length:369 start_codon:yes stop_codon:yes gene_type:complete
MIYEGKNGSVNAYFKNKLIVSRPLGGGRTLEDYKKESEMILVQALRDGTKLSKIKELSLKTIKNFRYEKQIKEPNSQERDFVLFTVLILIKLGVMDEDGDREGLLVMRKKKITSNSGNPVRQ